MSGMIIFSVFAAVNGLWVMCLALNISFLRIRLRVSTGDGGHKPLYKAVRVHMNAVENLLVLSVMFLPLCLVVDDVFWLAVLAGVYTLSRIGHAFGMLKRWLKLRQASAILSYLIQAVSGVWLLIAGLSAL